MSLGKSLLEILQEDNGLAVMDLQSLIVPLDRPGYLTELLKSNYVNVPDYMQDVVPVPKPVRFILDRYGHFFARHCGLNSEFSYTKQLLASAIIIEEMQFDEGSRRRLKEHGDNHFATLERAVLHYNAEGMTAVVVGMMPMWRLPSTSAYSTSPYYENSFYIYVESGRSMKPGIVSLINGSNIVREEVPIILCSDLVHGERERALGFKDKTVIMTPKALFKYSSYSQGQE